jgi:dihydrofolate reductase
MTQADQFDRANAGKVEWQVTVSLDGFIAGPDDDMDWVFEYIPDPGAVAGEVIKSTGAMLSGRRSYDVGRRDVGKQSGAAYGGAWSGPVFVLTHTPPQDSGVTFLSGDIREAVATALAAADGKNVAVTGANVARQCIEEGLIDEIVVYLVPVLLGDGVRLFGGPGTGRVNLERIGVAQSGQTTDLRFGVLK